MKRFYGLASAGVPAIPEPEGVILLALLVILVVGLGFLLVKGIRAWSIRRDLEDLRRAYHEAEASYGNLRSGLKKMAYIVSHLEDSRLALSARGVELLDKLAGSVMVLRRAQHVPFRRVRSLGVATRQLQELTDLDATFARFQQAVLVALYEQTVARVVMPPMSVRHYRASFQVLEHDLPEVLWLVMYKVLARHVELKVQDFSGVWSEVRNIGFRNGKEIVFNRRYLEDARELCLTVRHPDGLTFTSEFTVEHGWPL